MRYHHGGLYLHRWLFIGLVTVLVCVGRTALADEVTSQNTVLRGKITGLSAGGITFAPEYGKGSLAIKWDNIEDIKSDGSFQVLHGDGLETNAQLQGFRDGQLQAGPTAIDVKTIHSGVPVGPDGPSFNDRMRSAWRYWDGNLDAALNIQQSTTDTTGFLVGMKTVRTKDPTKFTLGANYRYGTEKRKGETKSTTQDQLFGLVRGDYSFTPRIYGFTSGDATYDGVQRLSIRGVPKAGLGYVIWERQLDEDRRDFLQAEVGPGWVYERYFGGADNDYFTIGFGALAGVYLPYGAHFDWNLEYLPAVDNFTTDYLLRTGAALTFPLIDPISAKLAALDEYDNTPSPGSDRNSLYITAGLSIGW